MKKGTNFEDYIHFVYNTLLNLKGEKIQVSRRTTFKVPPDETYEIDIFYEFINIGVRHRVAIECKDWKTAVDQGKVLEFHQKIKNIGEDIVGVFISRSGYQSGAKKVAKRHGILTLTADEIPTIFDILAKHITASFIPEDHCLGEPFWYIAELDKEDGEPTGTYYAFPKGSPMELPLFLSKKHALAYLDNLPDKQYFRVYGMAQHKLRGLLAFAIAQRKIFAIVFDYPLPDGQIKTLPIDAKKLKEEYLLLDLPEELEGEWI
ncbi:MAG: restriction endonuclease [Colwellia sp.]|nr:restriction endonuclease [Colwellia sp.]